MTVKEFCRPLDSNPDVKMHWMLPDKSFVPARYHITEVGKVQKDFIDCGGTVRSSTACVLQVWVANDEDHRLETTKLAGIMRVAGPLLQSDDLPMEVEYEQGVISQYPIGGKAGGPGKAWCGSGGGSTRFTSRSSVGRCLRKCHWPGYPSL